MTGDNPIYQLLPEQHCLTGKGFISTNEWHDIAWEIGPEFSMTPLT